MEAVTESIERAAKRRPCAEFCTEKYVCRHCAETEERLRSALVRLRGGLLCVASLSAESGVPRKLLLELYSRGGCRVAQSAVAKCEAAAVLLLASKESGKAGEYILKNDFGWTDKPAAAAPEQADGVALTDEQSGWAG